MTSRMQKMQLHVSSARMERSCVLNHGDTLRATQCVSLMGGQHGDVGIPHVKVMHFNISLRGKWMYERQDVKDLIKLVEVGTVVLGPEPAPFGGIASWRIPSA